MSGQVDKQAGGRAGGWTSGWMGERAGGRAGRWTGERAGRWTSGRVDKWRKEVEMVRGRADEWAMQGAVRRECERGSGGKRETWQMVVKRRQRGR